MTIDGEQCAAVGNGNRDTIWTAGTNRLDGDACTGYQLGKSFHARQHPLFGGDITHHSLPENRVFRLDFAEGFSFPGPERPLSQTLKRDDRVPRGNDTRSIDST